MKNIDNTYIDFIRKIKIIISFISENFGDDDILKRKNAGLIRDRDLNINNSKIKGYIFHGYGCEFRLENSIIDIEFDKNDIGFTAWSFYSFTKKIDINISEQQIKEYLFDKVRTKELKLNNEVYKIINYKG